MTAITQPTLEIQGLCISFITAGEKHPAVRDLSLCVAPGQTVCIAGESGCGKSVTALSMMGLLPDNARIDSGDMHFRGADLIAMPPESRRDLRGRAMAMVFQEPMTALNPVLTVGAQIAEVFLIHGTSSAREARTRALAMLTKVKISDPERRYDEYPHQMSGGMKQRVMIAIALAHEPALLIADEPTTALDVTIQAQILKLLQDLQKEMGTSIVFVTHDLAVVAEIADQVVVMYAGRIVERAPTISLFERPAHPYTLGLLNACPRAGQTRKTHGALPMIPGRLPLVTDRFTGCRFQARCPKVQDLCRADEPSMQQVAEGHEVACFFPVHA